MSSVYTQFGPVPREILEPVDEIKETSNTREIATVWKLKESLTLVLPERVEALSHDGTKQVLEAGQAIRLEAGQLMRRSCHVELLMPQDMAGAQPTLG